MSEIQGTLFPDERAAERLARARTTDRATSHEAAREVTPRISANQQMVMRVIREVFGDESFTDVALVEAYRRIWEARTPQLGLMLQTDSGIRTRRNELREAGLLFEAGNTKIGKRHHTLWKVST